MLSVKSLYTEYANERGEAVKAAQNVSFEVPEGKGGLVVPGEPISLPPASYW